MGKTEFGNCEQEISNLIKSFHPIIYIVSNEEVRVLESLNNITNDLQQYLVVWSETKGFYEYGSDDTDETFYPHMDKIKGAGARQANMILGMLEALPANTKNEAVVFVMRDLHSSFDKSIIVRNLRDINNDFRSNFKTLIILSPVLNIPAELERDVAVVHFDLPSKRDVVKIIWNSFKSNVDEEKEDVLDSVNKNYLEGLTRSAMGLTSDEIENVIARCLVKYKDINKINLKDVYRAKGEYINRKSNVFRYIENKVCLNDIVGVDCLKTWIKDKKKLFEISAKKYGASVPKGVCINGFDPVEVSKVVKALANEWELPLVKIDNYNVDMKVFRSEAKSISALAPFALWIDGSNCNPNNVISILNEEKVETSNPYNNFIIVTASTGYFEYEFHIESPNATERAELIKSKLDSLGRDIKNFNINKIVKATDGFKTQQVLDLIDLALCEVYSSIDDNASELSDIDTDDICKLVDLIGTNNERRIFQANSDKIINKVEKVDREVIDAISDDDEGNVKVDNRKKKLPLNKPKLDEEEEENISGRLKTVKIHSDMLDPHINKQDNLEVPGEIEMPRITSFKNDSYFDEEKIKSLKNQFSRYI